MSHNGSELVQLEKHVLKVQINCDGCKRKVRKLLKKIEGVYQVSIDMEEQTVTVSGNVDCTKLIKKLEKSGKHVEVWSPSPSHGQNEQLNSGWLEGVNEQDQMQCFLDGYNPSNRQPMLATAFGSEFDQWGYDSYPSNKMGISSMKGVTDQNFGAATEMDNIGDWMIADRSIIRGLGNTSSMRGGLQDYRDLAYNIVGSESERSSGLHSFYPQKSAYERYPPFMITNNLDHYQYDLPVPLTINSDIQNMHTTDNLMMHGASAYIPRQQKMMSPMLYTYPIRAYPYHWNQTLG